MGHVLNCLLESRIRAGLLKDNQQTPRRPEKDPDRAGNRRRIEIRDMVVRYNRHPAHHTAFAHTAKAVLAAPFVRSVFLDEVARRPTKTSAMVTL